jgi:hypothetical protein
MNLEQNATTDTLENDMHPYVRSQISRYVEDFRRFAEHKFSDKIMDDQVKNDLKIISIFCESRKLEFKPYELHYMNGIKDYLERDN